MVHITLNTLVLAVKWPNMSDQATNITENLNYYFTVIFVAEAIIKLTAFGCRYFKDKWNVFDFLIVAISIAFLIYRSFA